MKEQNNFYEKAKQMVQLYWHVYLLDRSDENFKHLFESFSDDLVLIGTGKQEFYQGAKEAIESMVYDQLEADQITFEILDEWYQVQKISDDVCNVYGTIWVREKPCSAKKIIAEMDTRFSVLCKKADDKIKICAVHHSVPSLDQGDDEFYPKTITEKANETLQRYEELQSRYRRDYLTGLYNRAYTEEFMNAALEEGKHTGAFLMIDIDDFKEINDQYGHLQGDQVLKHFADILVKSFPENALISRIGGDEFSIFLLDFHFREDVIPLVEKMLGKLTAYLETLSLPLLSCSIGIAFAPYDGKRFEILYQNADLALYHKKQTGKDGYYIFEPSEQK